MALYFNNNPWGDDGFYGIFNFEQCQSSSGGGRMKNYKATAISTIITEAIIVFLTLFSEMSEGFKNLLKTMSGHHWTSKGIIALILFFALYFALRRIKAKENDIWKYTKYVFWSTIVFSLIILL